MRELGQAQGGRGRPFTKGNGGRKPGAKNKTTQVAAALLAGEEQELVRKAIEVAKAGDVTMLKFLLGRILPRERTIKIDLPHAVYGDEDPVEAIAAMLRAVAEGVISPSEGAALVTMMESYRRAAEDSELAKRMDDLEAALKRAIGLLAGSTENVEPELKEAMDGLRKHLR